MKAFIKRKLTHLTLITAASFLLFCSCYRGPEITRYLKDPAWVVGNIVNGKRVDLRWEPVAEARQYVVYKIFGTSYDYAEIQIEKYASYYEIARTDSPEYRYEGSYDPKENGYTDRYYCYFGVRVVDENGNMSRVNVVRIQ